MVMVCQAWGCFSGSPSWPCQRCLLVALRLPLLWMPQERLGTITGTMELWTFLLRIVPISSCRNHNVHYWLTLTTAPHGPVTSAFCNRVMEISIWSNPCIIGNDPVSLCEHCLNGEFPWFPKITSVILAQSCLNCSCSWNCFPNGPWG